MCGGLSYLKHLQDLMEYYHIPFEDAFALQWKCLNDQYPVEG
jgi:hypothetical protein